MLYPAKEQFVRTREQLQDIRVPDRVDVSDRWAGLGHGDLANLLVNETRDLGLDITGEQWQVNPDEADLFGSIDIVATNRYDGGRIIAPEGLTMSLGIRHSNKSRFSIQLVAGATVFVCSNGMFCGDFVLRRKHTTNAHYQLPGLMRGAIIDAVNMLDRKLFSDVDQMRQTEVTSRQAEHLLVEAGRTGVMAWSQLGKVDREWRDPRHPEFKDRTAWSFYNAFTEVAKDFSARNQMDTIRDAKSLILQP